MNPNESTQAREVAYNRAVGKYLLGKLRAAPPAALANARRPEQAARALASIEAVLLKMTEGESLESALAGREKDKQSAPEVDVLDRDDVAELRALARESQVHHQAMLVSVRASRARIVGRAKDPAEAERWVDLTVHYHREAARASGEDVDMYDAMLRSGASSWRCEPRPS